MKFYRISGVNVSPAALQVNLIDSVRLNNPSNRADWAHIDVAPDVTQTPVPSPYSSTLYMMGDYTVAWSEYGSPYGDSIFAYHDNIFTNSNNIPTQTDVNTGRTYIMEGWLSDVAMQWSYNTTVSSGAHTAYFIVHDQNTQGITYADWDFTTVNNNYGNIEMGPMTVPPRIDAGTMREISLVSTKWMAVAEMVGLGGGVMTRDIHGYVMAASTGIVTPVNYSGQFYLAPNSNPLYNVDAYGPAVATGPNDPGYTAGHNNSGNYQYAAGFHFNDDFLALVLDGGNATQVQQGYDSVNNSYCFTSTLTSGLNKPAIAFTYGTNDGYGHAVAWYDGSDVLYKDCGNMMPYYKPTGIQTINISKAFAVFPNPATNTISVRGVKNGNYTVRDILGRDQMFGTLTGTGSIDVSRLAAGNYQFSVDDGLSIRHTSFVKQ